MRYHLFVAGIAAAGFIRGLHLAEGQFDRIKNPYLRHAIGMSIMGAMMYACLRLSWHYESKASNQHDCRALRQGFSLLASPGLVPAVAAVVSVSL